MKEIILYYSFTGNTRKYSEELSKKRCADLYEIIEIKKRSVVNAYTYGCFQSLTSKKSKINPITLNLDKYDKITIASPIWANVEVPAINNVFDILPSNKIVDVIFISASGKSNHKNIIKKIENRGSQLGKIEDIKI